MVSRCEIMRKTWSNFSSHVHAESILEHKNCCVFMFLVNTWKLCGSCIESNPGRLDTAGTLHLVERAVPSNLKVAGCFGL